MGDALFKPRLEVERALLKDKFPGFRFQLERGNILASGLISTSYGNKYFVQIEVSEEKYPYVIPSVLLPHTPPPSSCPHRFNDGSLCVMRPEQWTTVLSLAFMVTRAAVWVNKFDSWKRHGKWPGKEQSH